MQDMTAEELRAEADRCQQSAAESFERCDTDGFLSQWASGITARQYNMQARIAEAGGTARFAGLFNAAGERVKAKLVEVPSFQHFGTESKWLLLDEADKALVWVPRSGCLYMHCHVEADRTVLDEAPSGPSPRSKMAKMGLHEELESAPAEAAIGGSGRGLSGCANAHVYIKRTDKGYPEDAAIFGQ